MGHILVQPDVLYAAAAELDATAVRLQAALTLQAPLLHTPPAGSEEVSVLAAGYFTSLADNFVPAAQKSIQELHDTAATLRVQAAAYEENDGRFGSALAAGGTK